MGGLRAARTETVAAWLPAALRVLERRVKTLEKAVAWESRSEQVQDHKPDVWDSLDKLKEEDIHACVLPFQEVW